MPNKNNVKWSMLGMASLCMACTTAQQSATGSTSTSPSPGAGAATANAQAAESTSPPANGVAATDLRAAAGAPSGSIQVADVVNQAVGTKVTVAGVFMGFNGACLSDAPSRSAWHLAASKEPKAPCIYVDGPFPAGLSPAVHAGTNTTVTATVNLLGNVKYLVSTGE